MGFIDSFVSSNSIPPLVLSAPEQNKGDGPQTGSEVITIPPNG